MLDRLLGSADVLVQNLRSGVLAVLGFRLVERAR